jgi:RNA-directed DNA polymerase
MHLHAPLRVQWKALNQKLRGHYGYYGRPANAARLWLFHYRVEREWWRRLNRRSQRGLSWVAMGRLLQRYPLLTPAQTRLA